MGTHIPVLLNEAIKGLNLKEDSIVVDLTLGRAGHSQVILSKIKKGHLYAFDLDKEAIKESTEKLERIGTNFDAIHSSFLALKEELGKRKVGKVDAILADLGVSSPQLDEPKRGFTYNSLAPLDMRMDTDNPLTAQIVVNTYDEASLRRIIREYGEDKDAYSIAKSIVKHRPLHNTLELVEAIKKGKSPASLRLKGHPAKQTFQAIRMEVNGETKALKKMLEDAPTLLKENGRLAIITFMSLDDRLVKNAFHQLSVKEGDRHNDLVRPEDIEKPSYRLITKKPIVPSEKELSENRRSVSAKLRILEKI